MDGLGLPTAGLGKPARGAAGRRSQGSLYSSTRKRGEKRAQERGFASSRPACDHGDLALERAFQSRVLLGGKLDAARTRRRFHRALDHRAAHRSAPRKTQHTRCHGRFRVMEAAQIDRAIALLAERFRRQLAALGQFLYRARGKLRVHLEFGCELMFEVAGWCENMPLVGHPFEQKDYRSARTLDGILGNAKFLRHSIGGTKTDTGDSVSEHVRIAAHYFER